MQIILTFIFLLFLLITPITAHAYVGPGLGAGIVGLIIGILLTVFLGIFGIFYYPIKKLVQKIKNIIKK